MANEDKEINNSAREPAQLFVLAIFMIGLGVWITIGFGYACLAVGIAFLVVFIWSQISQIKDVK